MILSIYQFCKILFLVLFFEKRVLVPYFSKDVCTIRFIDLTKRKTEFVRNVRFKPAITVMQRFSSLMPPHSHRFVQFRLSLLSLSLSLSSLLDIATMRIKSSEHSRDRNVSLPFPSGYRIICSYVYVSTCVYVLCTHVYNNA